MSRIKHRIREEPEINQEEAAEQCGPLWAYYERGVPNVPPSTWKKIAKELKKAARLFEHV